MQLTITEDMIETKKFAEKYHYEKESLEQLTALFHEVCIKGSFIEVYQRTIMREEYALLPVDRAELMALTLGNWIDEWQEYDLEHENLTNAYMLDCVCNELLLMLYRQLNRQYAIETGRYVKRYHFIGEKIPLEEMPTLLALLDQAEITSNAYGVLLPKKSVVFLAETTTQREEECQGICQFCMRATCPNKSSQGFHLTYGYQKIFGA